MDALRLIQQWFEGLGWVANALTIFAVVVPAAVAARTRLHLFTGFSTFSALAEARIPSSWQDDMPKSLVDVAIVDDHPEDFPIDELRREGFRVKVYKQVRLSDISALARHDIVFLDMHGVIRDDIEQGGLKLIARLREENPSQKICAVSSKTFDPTATNFFRQADDVQKKPMNSQQCSEVIAQFIREKLNPARIAAALDAELQGVSVFARRQLIRDVAIHAADPSSADDVRLPDTLSSKTTSLFRSGMADFVRLLRHAAY